MTSGRLAPLCRAHRKFRRQLLFLSGFTLSCNKPQMKPKRSKFCEPQTFTDSDALSGCLSAFVVGLILIAIALLLNL